MLNLRLNEQISLCSGLWNLVSLFSNLCLFVLMPFAYFFLESEGFAGSKKVCGNVCLCVFSKLEALCLYTMAKDIRFERYFYTFVQTNTPSTPKFVHLLTLAYPNTHTHGFMCDHFNFSHSPTLKR